ncbi:WD40-repeat-containing domain protein [Lineolata rhizophorae]|uniref:WD40-repeat-containing domain protein n=1 Tax=Lineolata rhizophorae TaxID=578093 RepID=A0A6A6NP34_9PEZI|nr:WD40-repeat-containing domain protein [Lineolata rhizophorae]
MAKRAAEPAGPAEGTPLKGGDRPMKDDEPGGAVDGGFEDEFEDEFESEDEIIEAGVDGRPDDEREAEEAEMRDAMDVDQDTFIPGRHKLSAGETLSPDSSAYEMLHNLSATWPCLSLDVLRDHLGDNRTFYPATLYAVAGTQAARGRESENELLVMKLSNLSRTERDDEDDEDDNDDESSDADEAAEPVLETKSIPLTTTTNRIRAHQVPPDSSSNSSSDAPPPTLTASMTEAGSVLIHDVTPHLRSLSVPGATVSPAHNKPLCTVRAHKGVEGYALDWAPPSLHAPGRLLTGDGRGLIYGTTRTPGGGFVTDTTPFAGHEASVEEIQWSPNEASVFASGGADGTVRVWDARAKGRRPALSVRASADDVNVLSWSRLTTHLLASGHDDGEWAVWDLRQWKPSSAAAPPPPPSRPSPVASFRFHRDQITALEWHPLDDSIVLVAAGDSTLTLWDLAVELDDDESRDTAGVRDVPPQLLFVHYMEGVKEGHWHPQVPGAVVATGGSGFG